MYGKKLQSLKRPSAKAVVLSKIRKLLQTMF